MITITRHRTIFALIIALLSAAPFLALPLQAQSGVGDRVPFADSVKAVSATPALRGPAKPVVTRTALRSDELTASMSFELALKMRNFAELQARVATGERIALAELEQRYLPTAADYEAAAAWLASQGLTVTRRDPNHLLIIASGRVEQVRDALQVTFARVAFEGEEHTSAVSAPSLPAALADPILGINGLQPHLRAKKHLRAPGPLPAAGVAATVSYSPGQIANAYDAVPTASGLGVNGAGQTIGIVIDTFPDNGDLTSFWADFCAAPRPTLGNIQEVQVVAGALNAPSGEETLDVEWSSAMAPGATIRVYACLDLSSINLDQAYAQAFFDVATGAAQNLHQLSMSFGSNENQVPASQLETDAQLFADLASVGVTVFASVGDGGSNPDPDTGDNDFPGGVAQVEAPASSPTVIAVGGTTLTLSAASSIAGEVVWNDSDGATGGGISSVFSRPVWQTGTGVPAGTSRLVPDVASSADPSNGAAAVFEGAPTTFGGTSWASPMWAAFCALINQARSIAGQPPLGELGPKIYPLLGTAAFHDIVSGNNGSFTANVGFDMCTGLGTPNIGKLMQMLDGQANQPFVKEQPASQPALVGQAAAFNVTATLAGGGALSYQWQRQPVGTVGFVNLADAAPYSGVTTPTLSVTGVTAAMGGDQFQCVVSGPATSIVSAAATLLVDPLSVATFAGQAGIAGSADGTGTAALFNSPGGLAVDSANNIYVTDSGNNTVRKVTPAGAVTTLAGAAGVSGSADGTGSGATFNGPGNVAVDASGNVYVADSVNNEIRKITPAGVVTTLAGKSGRHGAGSANGTGTAATFDNPQGLAVDSAGNIYVADTNNCIIRKITPAGVVTTFAGNVNLAGNDGEGGSADGTGTAAGFSFPVDLTIDPGGNLYVADTLNSTIRKITTPGAVVTTFAGSAGAVGTLDGTGAAALFDSPVGVRTDAAGNLYVTDNATNTIRFITPAGVVTTIAGGTFLNASANGIGAAAGFTAPGEAQPDGAGHVYIADTGNDTLRIAQTLAAVSVAPAIVVSPASATVDAGLPARFAVVATGNPAPTFQWSVNGIAIQGATSSTLTLASVQSSAAGDYSVAVTNVAGTVTSSFAVLTVGTPPVFVTQPAGQVANEGQTAVFTASASGIPAPTFLWQRNGVTVASGATLTLNDVQPAQAGTYTAIATNALATVTSGAAVLTVDIPPAITANPVNATVIQGHAATFTVVASGSPAPTFQWFAGSNAISGATKPALTLANVQPSAAGSYSVLITNPAGSTTSAPVTLTVDTAPVILTQPSSETVNAGQTASFTVVAAGIPAPTFVWLKNGVVLAGATGSTLTLGDIPTGAAATYSVAVKNGVATVTSRAAVLTVDNSPAFATQPADKTVNAGQTATFTVVATGTPSSTIQWFEIGGSGLLATGPTLTLSNVHPTAAGSYFAVATNSLGTATSSAATLTVDTAPVISTQPVATTVTFGQTAVFTVAATGIPAPTFVWRKNGVAIANVSGPTLALTSVSTSAAAIYSVLVKNSVATVTSSGAVLTVDVPPAIATPPVNLTVNAGQTATFSVVATGTPSSTIEWFETGSSVPLATGAKLTLSNVRPEAAGTYFAVATNGIGTVTSSAATLTVDTAPVISTQPVATTVTLGQAAVFTVAATGIPSPTFVWRKNGVAIANASGPTLTLSNVTTLSAANYTVLVKNSVATVTSSVAALTVDVPPAIVTQPVKKTVNQGQTATFSVAATGTPSSTIKWFETGSSIALATGPTLTLSSVLPTTAGTYFAVATNGIGTATSSAVALTVNTLPAIAITQLTLQATIGTTISFTATVTGTPSPTVSWRKGGQPIGSAGTTLTLSNTTTTSAGSYTAVAVNSVGTVTSLPAVLTIVAAAKPAFLAAGAGGPAAHPLVALASPPAAPTGATTANSLAASLGFTGPTAILIATGGGTPGVTLQWFKNGVALDGATTPFLAMVDVQAADTGTYTVEAARGSAGEFAPTGFTIAGEMATGIAAIAWNGQEFVAVGDFGLILVSPDGSKWTPVYAGTAADFTNLVWNGSGFIASGTLSGGTGVPPVKVESSSVDGITWTSPTVIP